MPHEDLLVHANFLTLRCFDRLSTQFVEVENAVLKTCAMGPRPNMPLHESADAMTKQNARRVRTKNMNAASNVDAVPTKYIWPDSDFEKSCNAYVVEQVARLFEHVRWMTICPAKDGTRYYVHHSRREQPVAVDT